MYTKRGYMASPCGRVCRGSQPLLTEEGERQRRQQFKYVMVARKKTRENEQGGMTGKKYLVLCSEKDPTGNETRRC